MWTWFRRHNRSDKVVRIALQDSASVAALLITTEAMVAETPKDKAPAMPGWWGEWVEWAEWVEWTTNHTFDYAHRGADQ